MRILRKRKWLILLSVVLFTGAAVAGTAVWLSRWPVFTAVASLAVNPRTENILERGSSGVAQAAQVDLAKATYVQLAKGEKILIEAAKDKELRRTSWYQENPPTAIARLRQEIKVSSVDGTELIVMRLSGRNPRDLPLIVNAVAQAFEAKAKEDASQDHFKNIKQLQDQETTVRKDLAVIEEEIKRLRRPDAPSIMRELSVISQTLTTLSETRTNLGLVLQRAQQDLDAFLKQKEERTLVQHADVQKALNQDQTLQARRREQAYLQAQAEAKRQQYGEKHRMYVQIGMQLATLRRLISEQEEKVISSIVPYMEEGRTRAVKDIKDQLASVSKNMANALKRSEDLQVGLDEVEKRTSRRKFLDLRLQTVQRRLMELRLTRKIARPIRIAMLAVTPETPSSPKWSVMVPAGVFLGLIVGIGLAFLLEFVDTSIKSPTDITRRMDVPILGVIPHIDDLEEEIEDLHRVFATNPNSLIGEAFRQIRTCLQFAGPAGQTRSLLVTSPLPGDGRGVVSLNLAAAIAHGGRRVLVVDANFRQPMIRKVFPDCPEAGLTNALVGQQRWEDLVREVEPNLSVMSSGPLPPNPSELLGSDQMRNLLAEMTAQYDQVLFDGPPCLMVTDAPILSTLVDGVLLVIRAGANTHGVVQRAHGTLSRVGAHVLGVVLNGIRVTVGGYLRENYRTFYEYHEQETQETRETQELQKLPEE